MNFLAIASSDESIDVFKDNKARDFSNCFHADEYDGSNDWQVTLRSIFIRNPISDQLLHVHLQQLSKTDSYGKKDTLLCTLPVNKSQGKYLCFESTRGEYHPVSLSKPLRLTFQCRNEKGELSSISGDSAPTLITLNFKKMSPYTKIIHLCSSSNRQQFKSNSLAAFSNNLTTPLDLPTGNWHLALSSIVFPNNIVESFPHFSNQWKTPYEYKLRVQTYDKEGKLVVDRTIIFQEDTLKSKKKFINFFLTETKKYINNVGLLNNDTAIHFGHGIDFRLFVTVGLLRVLGVEFGNEEPENGWFTITSRPVSGSYFWHTYVMQWKYTWEEQIPSSMLLYCDAITPISWGEKQYQILKIVPLDEKKLGKKKKTTYIKYVPKHLDFIPIQKKFLSNISISLQTHWGQQIKFDSAENLYVDVNLLLIRK